MCFFCRLVYRGLFFIYFLLFVFCFFLFPFILNLKRFDFHIDELQLWTLNLTLVPCFIQTSRVCMHVLLHALLLLQIRHCFALFPTHTQRTIGFARVLHRSASPDSSLKCLWQPSNPRLCPSLFLHLSLFDQVSDGCCRISLCLCSGVCP